MAEKNRPSVVDGIVNLILGMMLMLFPSQLMNALDLPNVETNFYINVLGAVLFGIGIALFVESFFGHKRITGLLSGGAHPFGVVWKSGVAPRRHDFSLGHCPCRSGRYIG